MSTAFARAAVTASIRQDRIVWLEWSAPLQWALEFLCDDVAESGDVLEFWGERDGAPWRVHLDRDAARARAAAR